MEQHQVTLNNKSFEKVGITKDCQEVICEYIWNGFEAGATEVEVSFKGAEFQEAMSILIKDNGDGINRENFNKTFGTLLFSQKNSSSIRIKSQANKGKGRFSYTCISSLARWFTVYRKDEKLWCYEITSNASNIKEFLLSETKEYNKNDLTGTTVELYLSEQNIVSEKLSYYKMRQKLLEEFSWFLFLNKGKNVKLKYFGNELNYDEYIDMELNYETYIEIEKEKFHIHLIIWKEKIDNSSKIYYLSETCEIHAAENTGFNKNTVNFHHNVFVSSKYINKQNTSHITEKDTDLLRRLDSNHKEIFKILKQEIVKIIKNTLKNFLIREADGQISKMADRGTLPKFNNDEYGQLRRKDFETVTRELYCFEPTIFHRLKLVQEKSLLAFMNLLLESEERENLLTIVEEIVNLSPEQRESFARILQKTKLQFIIETMEIVERRSNIIERLKQVVFEMSDFCNERDHIQKMIETHFWLFGEQYHLLTADKTLATSLVDFEKITEQELQSNEINMSKKESLQRADIFLYTQQIRENSSSEMLIVELKAPNVKLSLEVFNQIVRYANTIRKEPRFSGTNRVWKFYAVCVTVDEDVKVKYKNFKEYGKIGLADIIDNFEIYALSWDDIFQAFDARHSPLFDKLKRDFSQAISETINSENETPSRETVNRLSKEFIIDNI